MIQAIPPTRNANHPEGPGPAAWAAASVIESRFDRVRRTLRTLRKRGPKSSRRVHVLRVACRRAGAALRTFEPLLDSEARSRAADELAKLRRKAGGVRAAEVHLKLYKSFPSAPAIELGLTEMIRRSKRRRRRQRRTLSKFLSRARPKRITTHGKQLVASLEQRSGLAIEGLTAEAISALGGEVHRRGQAPFDSIDQIHALRIAGKRLRYALEIVAMCDPTEYDDEARSWMTRFQDHLGLINDYDEMLARASKRAKRVSGKKLRRSLEALAQDIESQRDRQAAEFVGWWRDSGGAELDDLLRRVRQSDSARPSVTIPGSAASRERAVEAVQ